MKMIYALFVDEKKVAKVEKALKRYGEFKSYDKDEKRGEVFYRLLTDHGSIENLRSIDGVNHVYSGGATVATKLP